MLPAQALFATCTVRVVLRRDRVLRDYAFELLQELAPQIDRRESAPCWKAAPRPTDRRPLAGELSGLPPRLVPVPPGNGGLRRPVMVAAAV